MRKINTAILATLIVGASTFALAHGDETHAKKAGPVKKEQKAWGIAGDAKTVTRTVTFTMTDNMRFSPDKLEVKQGETIRFVIKNGGQAMHQERPR
jgi:uncharacterized cupredoxin-like copper-binding protein